MAKVRTNKFLFSGHKAGRLLSPAFLSKAAVAQKGSSCEAGREEGKGLSCPPRTRKTLLSTSSAMGDALGYWWRWESGGDRPSQRRATAALGPSPLGLQCNQQRLVQRQLFGPAFDCSSITRCPPSMRSEPGVRELESHLLASRSARRSDRSRPPTSSSPWRHRASSRRRKSSPGLGRLSSHPAPNWRTRTTRISTTPRSARSGRTCRTVGPAADRRAVRTRPAARERLVAGPCFACHC